MSIDYDVLGSEYECLDDSQLLERKRATEIPMDVQFKFDAVVAKCGQQSMDLKTLMERVEAELRLIEEEWTKFYLKDS